VTISANVSGYAKNSNVTICPKGSTLLYLGEIWRLQPNLRKGAKASRIACVIGCTVFSRLPHLRTSCFGGQARERSFCFRDSL